MDFFAAAHTQLSLEYGCQPSDFHQNENILTTSFLHPQRRRYGNRPHFFQMATFGRCAVLTADPILHPFLKEFMKISPGYELFYQPNLWLLQKELLKYDYSLAESYHMFLPRHDMLPQEDFSVKWFFDDEIDVFRNDARFSNALTIPKNPLRPDRIAVAAYDGDTLMGLAGCSEDADHWLQIGIDVPEPYRGQGVASHLVTLLKNRILLDGNIPFYGTTLSNYGSWHTALSAGFTPAFIEQTAFPVR